MSHRLIIPILSPSSSPDMPSIILTLEGNVHFLWSRQHYGNDLAPPYFYRSKFVLLKLYQSNCEHKSSNSIWSRFNKMLVENTAKQTYKFLNSFVPKNKNLSIPFFYETLEVSSWNTEIYTYIYKFIYIYVCV